MVGKFLTAILVMSLVLVMSGDSRAQEEELIVGEISLPSLRWGPQEAVFDVTNNAVYGRVVSVKTEISFEGTYLNPVRTTRSNYFVEPGATKTINQDVFIPGNYGKAGLVIEVYEVVDTLDPVLPYQRVVRQPFTITYHVPDALLPYFQEDISFPPRVNESTEFDSEFSRLLFLMYSEGKTVEEIAGMAQCDVDFVIYTLDEMTQKGYVSKRGNEYELRFPVITTKEAEEGKKLAETISDELAALVENNLGPFKSVMDSMVAAGSLPPNSDDFLHGGSVLYYTYPTVAALFFWFDLGQQFINPKRPLEIYGGTDLCRARIPNYVYAVQGGPYFNGTHFYHLDLSSRNPEITFSDSTPRISCAPGYENAGRLVQDIHWSWVPAYAPEPFAIDTALVKSALRGLRIGSDQLLEKASGELKRISDKYGHPELTTGAKYWFWNLTATRALTKLLQKGTLERHGNGCYRFEEL
jgi:DNA-binding MarR family transcriptional regulator